MGAHVGERNKLRPSQTGIVLPIQFDGVAVAPECTQVVYYFPGERLSLRGNLTCMMQMADKGLLQGPDL